MNPETEPANQTDSNSKAQEQTRSSTEGQTPKGWAEKIADTASALFFPLILIGTFLSAWVPSLIEKPQLDIVAHLESLDDQSWECRGRVRRNGDAVAKAQVWVIVKDARGNRDSPPSAPTDEQGSFVIKGVPKKLTQENVAEAAIFATAQTPSKETLKGREIITIAAGGSLRRIDIPALILLPLPTIFLVSVFLAFVRPSKVRHGFSILLAFLLTITMIVYLSLGLRYVNNTARPGELLSLGFGSIYQGTYVAGAQSEWLFSLTAPPEPVGQGGQSPPSTGTIQGAQPVQGTQTGRGASASKGLQPAQDTLPVQAAQAQLIRGFGAPLWVLLVAVVGAGILTVAIIVNEIGVPDFGSQPDEELRKRQQTIVQHQFYILFAPFGAIFVYQTLVAAEAATQPLTVALAALGAGASLNALLTRALTYTQEILAGATVSAASRQAATSAATAQGGSTVSPTPPTGVPTSGKTSPSRPTQLSSAPPTTGAS